MSNFLTNLLEDPPPSYAFELSEAGIAWSHGGNIQWRPFEEGVLTVTPSRDNVLRPEVFSSHIESLVPGSKGKRRPAALILPDFSSRVQVLDFDQFPSNPDEQLSLIKFRLRKTVPFDIDSAVVSYHVQPAEKRVDVVTALMSLEIVARYEAPFRAAGFQPGMVTTSSLAAINLAPVAGVSLLIKLSGRVMCVMVQDGLKLRLARTVELASVDLDEVIAVLHPTIAYVEDEMVRKPERLYLIGHPTAAPDLSRELNLPVEPLTSRFGTLGEYNAGLLGYLQGGSN